LFYLHVSMLPVVKDRLRPRGRVVHPVGRTGG